MAQSHMPLLAALAFLTTLMYTASSETPDPVAALQTSGQDLDDSAVSDEDLEFYKRMHDYGLGKRAYSYVSEYKRLPVYNFGLGKRSRLYSFGLGKRAAEGGRLYSFGLGKRTADYDDYTLDDAEDASSGDDPTEGEEDVQDMAEKRNRLYSFGLGKRARPYSFGLGKRQPNSNQNRGMYNFGLGKRAGHSMYNFGLGKRADGRLYAFGLGKRPSEYDGRQTQSRFSFGLGKRSEQGDSQFDDEAGDDGKRSQASQRFAFGLGKREISQQELDDFKTTDKDGSLLQMDGQHNSTARIAKRSLHYAFGLGKRSETGNSDEDNEDFARLARRPYSFGLGKRIPMYDLGVGKRSQR